SPTTPRGPSSSSWTSSTRFRRFFGRAASTTSRAFPRRSRTPRSSSPRTLRNPPANMPFSGRPSTGQPTSAIRATRALRSTRSCTPSSSRPCSAASRETRRLRKRRSRLPRPRSFASSENGREDRLKGSEQPAERFLLPRLLLLAFVKRGRRGSLAALGRGEAAAFAGQVYVHARDRGIVPEPDSCAQRLVHP